jgi:hydroxymethylpyrimidine/phosphomethylpyrimidine kinase
MTSFLLPAAEITDQWWHQAATVRQQIASSEFVGQLGEGSLPNEAFIWYLAQDALYLDAYSGFLAAAARLAPSRDECEFWEHSSTSAVDTELALHTAWVPAEVRAQTGPSATTQAYLSHLTDAEASGDYAILTAAVLPCFWIYAEVGEALAKRNHDAHPYTEWLATYSDEAFAEATVQAISIAGAAADAADRTAQEGAGAAFQASCAHELAFFNAPLRN